MDAGIKLLAVRFYKGKQTADVLVNDGEANRLINYEWRTQKAEPMRADWWSDICGEVEYQRGIERRQKEGTWVPQL